MILCSPNGVFCYRKKEKRPFWGYFGIFGNENPMFGNFIFEKIALFSTKFKKNFKIYTLGWF